MSDHPKRARREVIDADEASSTAETTSVTPQNSSSRVVDERNTTRPCTSSLDSAVSGTGTPPPPPAIPGSTTQTSAVAEVVVDDTTTTNNPNTGDTAAPVDQALEHHMNFLELDEDFKANIRSMSPNTRREVLNDIVRERRMNMAANMMPEAFAASPFAPLVPELLDAGVVSGAGAGGSSALPRTHRTRSDRTTSTGGATATAAGGDEDDEDNVLTFFNLGDRGFTILQRPFVPPRRHAPAGTNTTNEASTGTGRQGRHVSRTTTTVPGQHDDSEEYEDVPDDEDEDEEEDDEEEEIDDDEGHDTGRHHHRRHNQPQQHRERPFFLPGLASLLVANSNLRPEQQHLFEMYTRNLIARLHQNAAMAAMSLDRDIDDMSYEELLELEERIGDVSKGLTPAQTRASLTVLPHEPNEGRCAVCQEEWPTQHHHPHEEQGGVEAHNNNNNSGSNSHEPHSEERRCVRIKVCDHVFHEDCIVEWLRHNKTCPICTREVILT